MPFTREHKILIILLPYVLLSLYLFPPDEIRTIVSSELSHNNTFVVKPEDIFEPNWKNFLADMLQVPLELKWYDICFVNNGSRAFYGDIFKEDLNISVDFNKGQKSFEVRNGDTVCIPFRFDKEFTINWGLIWVSDGAMLKKMEESNIKKTGGNEYYSEVNFGLEPFVAYTYAKPEKRSLIIKDILLLVAWCGLVLFGYGVIKFIFDNH